MKKKRQWQIQIYDYYGNELYSEITKSLYFYSRKQATYYFHTHPYLFPQYSRVHIWRTKYDNR